MARPYPPDVLVLDSDALVHARIIKGKRGLTIQQAKSYRLASDTFEAGVVTPQMGNEAALAEVLRRLRLETGRWDKASLLLPDSWFRINILELQALPDNPNEAQEIKLSASYLRDTLQTAAIENCYLAGNDVDGTLSATIAAEFQAPVRTLSLSDLTEQTPAGVGAYEAELAACTGVFTG